MQYRSIDYPTYEAMAPGTATWSQTPGAVAPTAATVAGGYYAPSQDGGPYAAAVDARRNPGPTANPADLSPVLAPRPRWGASSGTGVAPEQLGGQGYAGVMTPLSYSQGRGGSTSEPSVQGPGHVRSFTGGGGLNGGQPSGVGGGSNMGGGPVPATKTTVGAWSAGVAEPANAPSDHLRHSGGVAGVVRPVGTGGPGTFPGGGTGDITTSPWDHLGTNEVDDRRLGTTGSDDAGPLRELSHYSWFGHATPVPSSAGVPTTNALGSGVTYPLQTRPTGRPGAGGGMMAAYQRPWDVEIGSVPNRGAKVVVQTGSPAYGPGGKNIQHAATPIMVTREAGKVPGYSGGAGSPGGMESSGYGRNSWRLTPQPWDVPVTDRG